MKQKLALACTLVHEPEVILLDEPTTGVDPVSRREFWKLLSQFLASGITILMSTPYLDEAERCSRVALLDSGRLLALDEPGRLRASLPGRCSKSSSPNRARAQGRAATATGIERAGVRRSPARLARPSDDDAAVDDLREHVAASFRADSVRRITPLARRRLHRAAVARPRDRTEGRDRRR